MGLHEVTKDEWASFLAKHRCFATEGAAIPGDCASPLVHKLVAGYDYKNNIISGEIIGMVRYHDTINKTYFIDTTHE